jgi:hypothetical protein
MRLHHYVVRSSSTGWCTADTVQKTLGLGSRICTQIKRWCHAISKPVQWQRIGWVRGVLMSDEEHLYLLGVPWPAGSPDLKIQDFVLRGYLKICAYRIAPTHTHTGAGWNCDKSRCAEFLGAFAELRKATICFIMSARLSVRMEKLGSHWMIFYPIWYFSIFWKSVEKNQVLVKSYKNNGYFTWRPTDIYDHTSLKSSQNEKCFRVKLYRKPKHTFHVQKVFFFENHAFYEILWKNRVQPDSPVVTL